MSLYVLSKVDFKDLFEDFLVCVSFMQVKCFYFCFSERAVVRSPSSNASEEFAQPSPLQPSPLQPEEGDVSEKPVQPMEEDGEDSRPSEGEEDIQRKGVKDDGAEAASIDVNDEDKEKYCIFRLFQ